LKAGDNRITEGKASWLNLCSVLAAGVGEGIAAQLNERNTGGAEC
jgi:hypothetical protein